MKIIFGDLLPGETPIDDISGLKVPGISTRAQLSILEAENIRKVLVKYFRDTPTREIAVFDLSWARELHEEMYCDVWEWAGRFRNIELNIGCRWTQVQTRLYGLLKDLKYWEENQVDIIEQTARLHHGAVAIHPFLNGNGRWGRMLADIWLAVNGFPEVRWPEEIIGSVSPIREKYIEALVAADNGDIGPLLQMHRAYLRAE
jgi:Fic-DOC domain mobile mystery protein B